ncbi:trypsin-like peptidase domain-containing protein [Patescibacteria group bacterium]|nr:trypsin-like peptidase domain-containing protein [Patescibacteria group bacterium]
MVEESATVDAVKKVAPAVVSIVISKDLSKINNYNNFPQIFFGFPFNFQAPSASDESGSTGKTEIGGGTGFIISSDGLILTNKHVASDAEAEYTVITNDDQKYDAKILATDPVLDIAVLKIDAKDLPTVELGDSDKIELGQTVIAIGNSLGEYKNTVTKGVVSGVGRRIVAGDNQGGSEVIEEAIQTDAAINPGNSGGPLVNLAGQVIAINTAMNQQGQLIGFAIPINAAKQDIESVKTSGKIVRPWLGVRYVLINEEIAKENKLEKDYGALVVRGQKQTDLAVVPGSPADKAGLVENDIVLEIDGQKIDEDHPLAREIAKSRPGDEITLKVLHKGEEKDIQVKLEEYKD